MLGNFLISLLITVLAQRCTPLTEAPITGVLADAEALVGFLMVHNCVWIVGSPVNRGWLVNVEWRDAAGWVVFYGLASCYGRELLWEGCAVLLRWWGFYQIGMDSTSAWLAGISKGIVLSIGMVFPLAIDLLQVPQIWPYGECLVNNSPSWLGWLNRSVPIHLILRVRANSASSIAWDRTLIWLLPLHSLRGHYNATIIGSCYILVLAWGSRIRVPIVVLIAFACNGAYLDGLIDGHVIASPHILGLDIRCLRYGLSILVPVDVVNHVRVWQGPARCLDIGLVIGRPRSPRGVVLTETVVFWHIRTPVGVYHGRSGRDVTTWQRDAEFSLCCVGASSIAVRRSILVIELPNGQGLCPFLGLDVQVLLRINGWVSGLRDQEVVCSTHMQLILLIKSLKVLIGSALLLPRNLLSAETGGLLRLLQWLGSVLVLTGLPVLGLVRGGAF